MVRQERLEAALAPPVSGPQANVGVRAAISGDTIALGGNAVNSYAPIYLFTRTGTTWTLQATLQIPVGSDPYWSLALDGNRLAVGLPAGSATAGRAEIHVR